MSDSLLAVLVVGGTVIFLYLLFIVIKSPIKGLYLSIASCGILITPSLPLVGGKLALPDVFIALTVLGAVVSRTRYSLSALQMKAVQLSLLFLLAEVFSLFFSLFRFGGDYVEFSIVETINYIYGIVLFILVVLLIENRSQWESCVKAYIFGVGVVSFVGTVAFLGYAPEWAYDDFTRRISSTLRMSNQVPSYLAGVFLFVIILSSAKRDYLINRAFGAALFVAITITLLGTGSRTAIGLAVAGMAAAVFYVLPGRGQDVLFRQYIIYMPVLMVILLALWVIPQFVMHDRYDAGNTEAYLRPFLILAGWESGDLLPTDTTRLRQFEVALLSFAEFPLFGVGPAVFQPFYRINEIHNTYLGVLAEGGVVSFLVFVLWLASVIKIGNKYAWGRSDGWAGVFAWAAAAGFVLMLLYGLVIYGLRQRHFWIMAGLVVSLPVLFHQAKERFIHAKSA
jgi:O-antigen ligase